MTLTLQPIGFDLIHLNIYFNFMIPRHPHAHKQIVKHTRTHTPVPLKPPTPSLSSTALLRR